MSADSAKLKEALQALGIEPNLEKIRARLEEREAFNIFEAIGMGGLEVRHSRFLAYLLSPRQNHGLRDSFVKGLLRVVAERNGNLPALNLSDLESWSLGGLEVRTEWNNIDILLTNEDPKFVVVIENKTWTGEHSDQLQRYRTMVEDFYPSSRRLFFFLTPRGDKPSDSNYISITYGDVENGVRRILEAPPQSAKPELISLLKNHYLPLLRREDLVEDKALKRLAIDVYRKHRSAIEYLNEVVGDESLLRSVKDCVVELIRNQPDLLLVETGSPKRVIFVDRGWEDLGLRTENAKDDWQAQFQFLEEGDELNLVLRIQPAQDDLGRKIVGALLKDGDNFRPEQKQPGKNKVLLTIRPIFKADRGDIHESSGPDDEVPRKQCLRKQWESFVVEDLPRIRGTLRQALAVKIDP
jgi:hypothetical protein